LKIVLYDEPYDSYFTFAEFNAANDPAIQFNTNTKVEGGNLTVGGDIKGNFITDKDGTNPLVISGSQGIIVSGSFDQLGSVNLRGITTQVYTDVLVYDTTTGTVGYSSAPVGPQGPQGNTGPQGDTGAQGNVGPTGPQGNTGAQGDIGPQGDTGATGPQGNQGNTGATGPQGDIGPIGPQGNQGNAGPLGPQGNQGNTGATGPQGNQGNTGPQGTSFSSPYIGDVIITGSLQVTNGITGSLLGSSSYAINALTASFALNGGGGGGAAFPFTGSAVITGSLSITGSVNGSVGALSISSNTASLNLSNGDFFTLQLVSGSNTRIEPSNIKAGQTVNILLSTTGSATVSFPTSVKQISGSSYIPTTTTSKDVITLVSFDSSTLYLANVKNLV
jgi:hypothetical protein